MNRVQFGQMETQPATSVASRRTLIKALAGSAAAVVASRLVVAGAAGSEVTPGTTWRTGAIRSLSSPNLRVVQFASIDGQAVLEGDIILGTTEELEATLQSESEATINNEPSDAIVLKDRRWPGGVIPYEVADDIAEEDGDLPQRVTNAIKHWEENTPIRFLKRTTESDFVVVKAGAACSAYVGKHQDGGEQFVRLSSNCSLGNIIHELGHTVGLWHEQSRDDRDFWIVINWDKIMDSQLHNFDQHIIDGVSIGGYDYASIMHYPPDAFSIDGSPTIIARESGVTFGQRDGLSAGDIAAVVAMYEKV